MSDYYVPTGGGGGPESDPIIGAWDKSTGISITESQVSDLGVYLENIIEDTTPQLGGDLDPQTFKILDGSGNTFIDPAAGLIYSTGVLAVNAQDRILKASDGTTTALDFASSTMLASRIKMTGLTGLDVDFDNSTIFDEGSSGFYIYGGDFNAQYLGNTVCDFATKALTDALTYDSVLWGSRQLMATDGTTVTADWSNGFQVAEVVDIGGAGWNLDMAFGHLYPVSNPLAELSMSAGWLTDTSGVLAMDFGSRLLKATDGTTTVLNFATQAAHINDPSGGGTVDSEARTAIAAILNLLETYGLMAP